MWVWGRRWDSGQGGDGRSTLLATDCKMSKFRS